MFNTLKARINQGTQFIKDIRGARVKAPFRGLPSVNFLNCNKCSKCIKICPSDAICLKDQTIDIGKCVFCGECQRVCDKEVIKFTTFHKLASDKRSRLLISDNINENNYRDNAIEARKEIRRVFKRSLKIREVSAGGCNGCEMELNACSNVNFDMGRYGIDIVASPRHADCLLITGPISENMSKALEDAYNSMPSPKLIILAGSCAISGGIFGNSDAINRSFLEKHKIDLYIPGCPVHPLTVINGILDLISDII